MFLLGWIDFETIRAKSFSVLRRTRKGIRFVPLSINRKTKHSYITNIIKAYIFIFIGVND